MWRLRVVAGIVAGIVSRVAYVLAKKSSKAPAPVSKQGRGQSGGRDGGVSSGRVLSISSTVVYGYVGNKASTLPLQLLGFDVDPINSVQLSNHTGYASFTGQKLQGAELDDLLRGLEKNEFLACYTHLMTGYLGTTSFLEKVAALLLRMKRSRPGLTLVVDPVMGDNGKMYVPRDFVRLYRERMVPHASLLTPNQTEAELLSERKIKTLADAHGAARALMKLGAKNVVITSLSLPGRRGFIDVVATGVGVPDGCYYHLELKQIDGTYSGCGDLCCALLLAWFTRHPNDMCTALEKTFATLSRVIGRTLRRGTQRRGWTELELVTSKCDIEEPNTSLVRARLLGGAASA